MVPFQCEASAWGAAREPIPYPTHQTPLMKSRPLSYTD